MHSCPGSSSPWEHSILTQAETGIELPASLTLWDHCHMGSPPCVWSDGTQTSLTSYFLKSFQVCKFLNIICEIVNLGILFFFLTYMRMNLDVFTDPMVVSGATLHSQQDSKLKDRGTGGQEDWRKELRHRDGLALNSDKRTGLSPSWYLVEVGTPVWEY